MKVFVFDDNLTADDFPYGNSIQRLGPFFNRVPDVLVLKDILRCSGLLNAEFRCFKVGYRLSAHSFLRFLSSLLWTILRLCFAAPDYNSPARAVKDPIKIQMNLQEVNSDDRFLHMLLRL